MSFVNSILRKFFYFLFFPVKTFSPWAALSLVSILTALFLLAIYRLVSDQAGIKTTKDKIKAYLLELRLFSDDFLTSLRAQAWLLFWNLKYFLHALRPLAVMIIPLIFILSHLDLWFGGQPLSVGQTTVVRLQLKENYSPLSLEARIEPGSGYEVETPALRIEETREINWRIRGLKPGEHEIIIDLNGQKITKKLSVGRASLEALARSRPASGLFSELLAPGEKPLPDSPLKEVSVVYPSRRLNFLGLKFHWLVAYFILSIFLGFLLKKPLKVEI